MAKMTDAKLAAIGRWGVLLPPALLLLFSGINKFTDPASWEMQFVGWGLATAFVPIIGAWEILAAVLMFIERVRFYGGTLGVLVMVGAAGTHAAAGEYVRIIGPLIIAILAGITAYWARPDWLDEKLEAWLRPKETP